MTEPSGGFFLSSQIEARCHFYWFDMKKSDNITFYSHNGWVFKVIQAVSVVIWVDSEQISPVCSFQLVGLLWTDCWCSALVRKLNCHILLWFFVMIFCFEIVKDHFLCQITQPNYILIGIFGEMGFTLCPRNVLL